jgi:hypothetical protein
VNTDLLVQIYYTNSRALLIFVPLFRAWQDDHHGRERLLNMFPEKGKMQPGDPFLLYLYNVRYFFLSYELGNANQLGKIGNAATDHSMIG